MAPARLSWPGAAAIAFGIAWLLAAWKPLFPQDWALENVLALASAWWLLRRHRRAPLSDASYVLLAVFGIAHLLGSHYTYAEVPYDDAWRALFGGSLNEALGFERNHYDRLVHFGFGLLCYRPLREIFAPAMVSERGRRVAPVAAVMGVSMVYEQVEMIAALVFGGELGQAYLGTQGDLWDAQKDSALAVSGAVTAAVLGLAASRGYFRGASKR